MPTQQQSMLQHITDGMLLALVHVELKSLCKLKVCPEVWWAVRLA